MAIDVEGGRAVLTDAVEHVLALLEPVLAWWAEDIDVQSLLECFRLVRHVRWNQQHLPGADDHFLRAIVTDPELESALKDVGELLVLVGVLGDDAAFLQIDMCEHHAIAGDETTLQHVGHPLLLHRVPAIKTHSILCGH